MKLQEIFDKVATHLLTQNRKSQVDLGTETMCLYRGPDGTKCAAGCLIPDELYSKDMENEKWKNIIRGNSELYDLFPFYIDARLIQELQDVHDNFGVKSWPGRLGIVASNFDLDASCLDLSLNIAP